MVRKGLVGGDALAMQPPMLHGETGGPCDGLSMASHQATEVLRHRGLDHFDRPVTSQYPGACAPSLSPGRSPVR